MSEIAAVSDGVSLQVPGELLEAMRPPASVMMVEVESSGDGVFLSGFDPVRVAKRLVRRRPFRIARASQHGETAVVPIALAPGTYRIVSYHPRYYLLPDRFGGGDAASRASSWASEEGYHEHRRPSEQDEFSRWFSQWFADSVIAPQEPRRVLELGCGAGRNLVAIQRRIPGVEVVGVDINPGAVTMAKEATGAEIVEASLYDLPDLGRFDVAYTCGVLMHIPHEDVAGIVRTMDACATATAHFELHGACHGFDFHRYPRDYGNLYEGLGLRGVEYQVFPRRHRLNGGESVGEMALLTRPAKGLSTKAVA